MDSNVSSCIKKQTKIKNKMYKFIIFDEAFFDFLRQLIASGRLNETEAGIAKQALEKGYESLTEKQKYVFKKAIEKNTVPKCKQCGGVIPWDEMLEALENGGLCSDCTHFNDEIDKE